MFANRIKSLIVAALTLLSVPPMQAVDKTVVKGGSPDGQASQQGFHLVQKSMRAGEIEVLITQDMLRFTNKLNALSSTIDGTTAQVTIVNHEKKQYCKTDLAHWSPTASYMTNLVNFSDYGEVHPAEILTKQVYLNFPADKEILKNPTKFTTAGATKTEKLTVVSAEIITCPLLTKNRNFVAAATKYYDIAGSKSFPLNFESTSRKGSTNKMLRTIVLEKKAINLQEFKIPANYTTSKNQREIYLDSAGADTLQDMLK